MNVANHALPCLFTGGVGCPCGTAARSPRDSARRRVQRMGSQCTSHIEDLWHRSTLSHRDTVQLQRIGSQCSSLVEHHRVHGGQCLQRLQPAYQNALARKAAGGRQHARWRCQRQRTRTGNHQHSDGNHHGMAGVARPPVGTGSRCSQQHDEQEGLGNAISEHCQARPGGRRAVHQGSNAGKSGIRTNALHAQINACAQVVAAGHQSVPRLL